MSDVFAALCSASHTKRKQVAWWAGGVVLALGAVCLADGPQPDSPRPLSDWGGGGEGSAQSGTQGARGAEGRRGGSGRRARAHATPGEGAAAAALPGDGSAWAGASEEDVSLELPAGLVAAASHFAPALGLEVSPELKLAVEPSDGALTLFEVDGALPGGFTLRRARTVGEEREGIFGRGWRSELESRVTALGEGFVVTCLSGSRVFEPLEEDLFVSRRGEVELLQRWQEGGFELLAATGQVLRFDVEGTLLEVVGAFEIERVPGALKLETEAGRVQLSLDGQGRVVSLEGAGLSLAYGYNSAGELIEIAGDRTRSYLVQENRLVGVAGGSGPLLEVEYERQGRLARLEKEGHRQTYHWDQAADGRARVAVQAPAGEWEYTMTPEEWTVKGPAGEERVLFDRRGRLVARLKAGGAVERVRRDELGQSLGRSLLGSRVTAPRTLPSGAPLESTCDEQGRLLTLQSDGVREEFAYDKQGRVTRHTTPDGRTREFEYEGQQVTAERGPAGTTHYVWDALGRLQQVKTPGGRSWRLKWGSTPHTLGLIRGLDGPADKVAITRDRLGREVSRRDTSGREVFLLYDAQGRIQERSTNSGEVESTSYDSQGRPTSQASEEGEFTYQWDKRTGALQGQKTPAGVELRYRREGGQVTAETPWGAFATTFDDQGRAEELDTPAGRFLFDYDAEGQRERLVLPNGLVTHIGRDPLGRVVHMTTKRGSAELLRFDTRWDEHHERVSTAVGEDARGYRYDHAGRLAEVWHRGDQEASFSYDPDGNRIRSQRAGARPLHWRYTPRGRLLSIEQERAEGASPRLESFRHDSAGRLIERRHPAGVDRFAYDGFGRLVKVERAGSPAVEYRYDPLGRISRRLVAEEETRYVYDGERLLAEVGPGESERVFVYGPDRDEPLAYLEDGQWTYLLSQDLGHTLAYTDEKGELLGQVELDPWGEVWGLPPERPVFFSGRRYDPIARLYHLRARHYDPTLGRFICPDPAGLLGGINGYVYAENSPLDLVDPSGLWSIPSWRRVKSWAGHKAHVLADTAVGAGQGLQYLTGFGVDEEAAAAARQASWQDVAQGRAGSRALGAIDGYVNHVSSGIVPRGLISRWAPDQEQVALGRAYGKGGGVAFDLATVANSAARQGGRTLWSGATILKERGPKVLYRVARRQAKNGLSKAWQKAPEYGTRAAKWAWDNRETLSQVVQDYLQDGPEGAGVRRLGSPGAPESESAARDRAGLRLLHEGLKVTSADSPRLDAPTPRQGAGSWGRSERIGVSGALQRAHVGNDGSDR